jgi:crotonobetainyl-CoA:carnitine CoA-transferase CaiB-like acyl-CoA transferase
MAGAVSCMDTNDDDDIELLGGTHVVELAGPFGADCARFLASLGARVTRVVSPRSPVAATGADRAAFMDVGPGPHCVELDLRRGPDAEAFRELLAGADFLIESAEPHWLHAAGFDDAALEALNPRLIHASITPFGRTGPYSAYRGGELVASAMSGALRTIGYEDRAPVKEALDACTFHACAAAATGVMFAHHERGRSGRGQHVDVALQEVSFSRNTVGIITWQFDRRKLGRSGPALRYGRARVRCVWELRDGYAFHSLMSGRLGAPANAALSRWMDECGCDNPIREVDWLRYDRSALPAATRAIWEQAIANFFRARTKHEIATEGRRRGINASVAQAPEDVLADPQLHARGYFEQVALPDGRSLLRPSYFLKARTPRAHASKLARPAPPAASPAAGPTARGLPLAGVKVLDFSWALVGSLTTKNLADHGAQVIKVESSTRPCLTRMDIQIEASSATSLDDKPWFAHLNTSKLGLRLDMKHPRARAVLDPLLQWADVVVENFSPGTLRKLGLDYERLCARRPDLIMVSGSIYGQTGPLAHEWGIDGTAAALSGRLQLTGWPDRAPVIPGGVPYGDVVVPQFMAAAVAAALEARRRTGQGCYLDASMVEVCTQQTAAALFAAQLGQQPQGQPGRRPGRSGNRSPDVLLQGVYPSLGQDRWIAISLFEPSDWHKLGALIGGQWPDAEALYQADEAWLDSIDQRIGAWTAQSGDFALMERLQAEGIAAGVVADLEDLVERDPQLRVRGALAPLDHPRLGRFGHHVVPYRLSRTPAQMTPAPLLGQHTRTICQQILGMSDADYDALAAADLFV